MKKSTFQVFTTVGDSSWVCPSGVTFVDVECWGGGGAGGVTGSVGTYPAGGGGGGYARKRVTVTPGTTYKVRVGDAGVSILGSGFGAGTAHAGNSEFLSNDLATTYVRGCGGDSIYNGDGSTTIAGGKGGGASGAANGSNIGDVTYAGGDGGSKPSTSTGCGGGGGGAGRNGAGTAGNPAQTGGSGNGASVLGGPGLYGHGKGGLGGLGAAASTVSYPYTGTWGATSGSNRLISSPAMGYGGAAGGFSQRNSGDKNFGQYGRVTLRWIDPTSLSGPQTLTPDHTTDAPPMLVVFESGETAADIVCWGGGSTNATESHGEGEYDARVFKNGSAFCHALGAKSSDNSTGWVNASTITGASTGSGDVTTGGGNGGTASGDTGGGGGGGGGTASSGQNATGATGGGGGSSEGGVGGTGGVKNGAAPTNGAQPGGGAGGQGAFASYNGGGGGGCTLKNATSILTSDEFELFGARKDCSRYEFSSAYSGSGFATPGNGQFVVKNITGGGGSTVMPSKAAVVRQAVHRSTSWIIGKLRGLKRLEPKAA